jgi:hypothetical protein
MRQKEVRPYRFLALAAGLIGILLVLGVPSPKFRKRSSIFFLNEAASWFFLFFCRIAQ